MFTKREKVLYCQAKSNCTQASNFSNSNVNYSHHVMEGVIHEASGLKWQFPFPCARIFFTKVLEDVCTNNPNFSVIVISVRPRLVCSEIDTDMLDLWVPPNWYRHICEN